MTGLLHRERESDGPLFDSLSRGRELRDEGVETVASRPISEEWREKAKAWIEKRCRLPGPFNADDLRAAIGDPPGHPNVMGSVFLNAVRAGLIERCGERPRLAASAHAQKISLYQGTQVSRGRAA